MFDKFPGVVKLVLQGHCHDGGFNFDERQDTAYLTIDSPLLNDDTFGIVSVYADHIDIKGSGGLKSRKLEFLKK